METLNDIKAFLEQDETHYVDVYDPRSDKRVLKLLSLSDITEKYGDFEEFLEALQDEYPSITVVRLRRHKRTYTNFGAPQLFKFSTPEEVQKSSSHVAQTPQQNPTMAAPVQSVGLFGGVPGLGFQDFMRASNKATLYEEAARRRDKAENKIDLLEKEVEKYKEEAREYKQKYEQKPDALTDIAKSLAENGQMGQIIEMFAVKKGNKVGDTPALNAPDLAREKRELIKLVSAPETTVKTAINAYYLIKNTNAGNEDFIAAFNQIVKPQKVSNNAKATH